MNYEQVQKLNPADFKRYGELHKETFKEVVKIVKAEKVFQKKSGIPSKLCVEDQILMTYPICENILLFFIWELNGVLMNQMLSEL